MRYWLLCVNEHSLKSSFEYGLYTRALNPADNHSSNTEIENIRKKWLNSNQSIESIVFGAESTVSESKNVRQIAAEGISHWKLSKQLCGVIDHLGCESVLELGTSLGINAAYLAGCQTVTRLVSVDANSHLINLAKQTLHQAEIPVELITGEVDAAIEELVKRNESFDLVFVDANHTYEATLRYFQFLKHLIHDESVIIFDDINWSPEMTKAWNEIKADAHVTMAVENFQIGLIFFNSKYTRKSYVLDF